MSDGSSAKLSAYGLRSKKRSYGPSCRKKKKVDTVRLLDCQNIIINHRDDSREIFAQGERESSSVDIGKRSE